MFLTFHPTNIIFFNVKFTLNIFPFIDKEIGGKRETRYSWYQHMGDRVPDTNLMDSDAWESEIKKILNSLLKYWYAVRDDETQGVPTTGHTHDFSIYINDILAILVGESISGSKSTEDTEVFKTIPGFIRALNFYTRVCGIIVGVDTVVLMYAYFDCQNTSIIHIDRHSFVYDCTENYPKSIMGIVYCIANMLKDVLAEARDTGANLRVTRALDVTFDRAVVGRGKNVAVYGIYTGQRMQEWIKQKYPLYYHFIDRIIHPEVAEDTGNPNK